MSGVEEAKRKAKTCVRCGKAVPFPLWFMQRKTRPNKPLCPVCVAHEKIGQER